MKKKLIQILMLMVATVSVGSFVSCKDTNEDLYNELRTQNLENATVAEALEARIKTLEDLIGKMKACECDTTLMLSWVNAEDQHLQDQIDELNKKIADLAEADNYYTKEEIDKMIADLANEYAKLLDFTQLRDDFQKHVIAYTVAVTLLQEKVKDLEEWKKDVVSCKCDLEKLGILEGRIIEAEANASAALELAQAAKNLADINKTNIENLQKTVDGLETKVTVASTNAANALEEAAKAKAKADANEALISALTARVAVNETNITNLQETVNNLSKLAEQVGANTEAISTLKTNVQDLSDKYDKMSTTLATLQQQVEDCQKICAANLATAKAELRTEIQELKTELLKEISANSQAIEDIVKQHEADVEWIKEALRQLGEKAESLTSIIERLEKLEKTETGLDERLKDAETKLKDLEPRVQKLENNVRALWDHMKVAEDQLKAIIPVVWGLTGEVDAIQEYLRSQVTGLIVQGTYNPMFGSFSIPANIQSNVLVAYYGKPKVKIEFPTTDDANYVRKKEALTAKDWEMISDVEKFTLTPPMLLINEAEDGNASAGKVYVTVNPTSFDATGLQLDIVNTQDVVSPITLSPLQKSDATLQFGFTRADNGFYEAEASIKKKDLDKVELAFNEETIRGIIAEAQDKMHEAADNFFNTTGASGDLGWLATRVYNIIHELRIDQSGLKCPYKDFEGKDQAIYSQYNIAATVLRPLSLASFKDLHFYTIPGYEDVNDFLDKIAATLNGHVHVIFQDNNIWKVQDLFNNLQVEGIDLASYTNNLIARFNARVSHFNLNGLNYTLTIPGTGYLDVKFNKNLTDGGSAVTIPEEIAYDESNPTIKKSAIVIGGDITTGLTTMLVVPAVDGDGIISAYACIDLIDVTATLADGEFVLTSTNEGARAVAVYAGGAINATGYPEILKFDTVVGADGEVNIPVVTEIAGDAAKIVEELTKLLNEVNDALAQINKYEDIIAGENGWINKFINQYIRKYLDKINHTSVYFFNSINRRFGPFLVASNDYKGFKRLSTNVYLPTELEKEGLHLYPTTKNMELIVPIARKHIAVTNVYDGTGKSAQKDNDYNLVKALKDVNASDKFNTVIDGTERMIAVDPSTVKSGYTYEVAYSVLDFEGKISTQKYYIKIK